MVGNISCSCASAGLCVCASFFFAVGRFLFDDVERSPYFFCRLPNSKLAFVITFVITHAHIKYIENSKLAFVITFVITHAHIKYIENSKLAFVITFVITHAHIKHRCAYTQVVRAHNLEKTHSLQTYTTNAPGTIPLLLLLLHQGPPIIHAHIHKILHPTSNSNTYPYPTVNITHP